MQPAVADRRLRGLGVLVVALHDDVRADDNLADLLAVGADVAPVGVHDPKVDPGERPAGPRLALLSLLGRLGFGEEGSGRGERENGCSLREPVADDRLAAEGFLQVADQRGRRGRAAGY